MQTRSESIETLNDTLQRVDRNHTNFAKSIGDGVACYPKTTMDVTKFNVVGSEDIELKWLLSNTLKSELPARYNKRVFAVEASEKQYRGTSGGNRGYVFVIGGVFNHLEDIEVTDNTHCTWIKTPGTRGKKCLDKVYVSNTGLNDQAETIKT